MTSLRMAKTVKSAVAVIVSGSLFITTAVMPVAAQTFRAGNVAEAGSSARASFTPSTLNGVQALPNSLLGSTNLVPTLSPAPAPTALALPLPAAVKEGEKPATPAPAAQPAKIDPAAPVQGDAGPRWVKTETKPAPAEGGPRWVKTGEKQAEGDGGPRWVGPQKSGLRATLVRYLPFLGRSGSEAFDGSVARKEGLEDAPIAASGAHAHAGGLTKPSARAEAIINDETVPTPEAARRVGALRQGTPIWAKVAAPLSVAAAVAVAISFGAVPVLTLAVGLVVSVLAHEVAHLAVLHRLGDHTAEHAGSHSLNPFNHIDAVKTVIVPALSLALSSVFLPFPLLLGAGKPVDADFNNLRSPFGGPRSARNAFWVAAAGPATNLLIAGAIFGAAALLPAGGALALVAAGLWKMNLALAVFNMLPLPQLDGGKILASILPERFYAKWVFNPRVERGYQSVFRKLYEGPSNILTWLGDAMGVRTQKGVNRLANTLTFTALAAFYAAAYFHFALALPLLFLALPCAYDYWCIREKVRSEAAVQDLMELMSQWSAVIVMVAEDMGLESEVSAFETEHAMKNALETLIDEMMAKDEFRALSDEQKIEALMKEYPDKAAGYLKEKAMPEDSLEKIKAVLADPRNGPFYERLTKWFKEHEIFARWDNKHQQGKLKDALKDADKEKSRAGGGLDLPENLVSRAVTALMRVLSAPSIGDGPVPQPVSTAPLAAHAWASKIKSDANYSRKIRIYYSHAPAAMLAFRQFSQPKTLLGGVLIEISPRTDAEAAELVRRLAEETAVKTVTVSPEVRRLLMSRYGPIAPTVPDAGWQSKLARVAGLDGKVRVVFASGLNAAEINARLRQYGGREHLSDRSWDITVAGSDDAAEVARVLAEDERVQRVVVSPAVHARLTDTTRAPAADPRQNELPFEPAPETQTAPQPEPSPELAPPPAPPAKPSLPAKIVSHGKAEYGVNVVLVKFAPGTAEAAVSEVMSRHGAATLYHHGDMYTLSAANAEAAREKAVALAAEASVETVKVHPNAAAKLTEEVEPYPDAAGYDHDRALIVEFRFGATEESIKEYAEVRLLELIHTNFRGSTRAAVLAVPKRADMRATLRMLVDETAAAHSAAESVRPFQEQPGEAELKPSEKAVAAAVVEEVKPEAPAVARRDPAQAWQEYLQNITLSDGKSKLTDKQVQLLTVMLKPLARGSDEKRPPIVGRGEEIKRILPIVTSPRGMRNSVILVGEAGVGKTAVPEGLAEMIEDATAATAADSQAFLQFERLKGRWLVELDINKILTQDDPVGMLAVILDLLPRLNKGGPSRGNDIIVLMDEIQKFFLDNAGQKIANTLKGPLRDGKISVIATTTRSEYKKFIETDDAFRRRFEKIDVEEPTIPQTISILRAMKAWLQGLHDSVIPDSALVDAAKLADQFDKTNFNPDKAIKAVQDAAELSRPDNLRAAITLDLRETWGELVVAANEARQALVDKGIASTLALPVDLYNKIAWLVKKAEALYGEREAVASGAGQVTTEVVKRVIAAKTGIASGQLNLGEDDASRYTNMEAVIGARVVNQERALTAIANAVRRNKAGLSNPNRPMGKFLLTGPTGVGKTYLAKELARFLFNDPEAMVRMDMSEYMEEHTAQRLTGSPPGYVGYGEGGQLTEAVRKKPYSVILFDEIEKAHPKVFDVLLQILDDGRLTDGQGRTVDFKNTVIIMTSNAGMKGVDGEKYAKLLAKVKDHNEVAEINKLWDEEIDLMVGAAIKERFRPEFLNRLDEDPLSKSKWIRVNRLRPEDIAKIATIQLKEFQHLLADRHDSDIQFDQSAVDFLAVEGYSPLYGARPMTAAIEKNIIDPLAKWILSEAEAGKRDIRGALIQVSYADGKIVFAASKKPEKNTARATVQGASEAVAAELFSLIERLSGAGEGEEPSENLFDQLMRKARLVTEKSSAGTAGGTPASRTQAFFAPGTGLEVRPSAADIAPLLGIAADNNSKKKDAVLRGVSAKFLAEIAATGWSADILQALDAPASGQGEGWIKQIVKLVKEQATKAAATAPVTLTASADKDAIRIAVGGKYALSDDDQKSLLMHFSGTPPASYLAAQQKADNLNLSARLLWDHNLLDLYRRLSAIPGARMGFKTGPEGTQIWLDIRRSQSPPPALNGAPSASSISADKPAGTPHQLREMAKTRELMMKIIDQSRLKENERDGHAIRIAAAEGYALLSTPSDAATAREWINAKKWGADVVDEKKSEYSTAEPKLQVGEDWPLAMTAALILERFGGAESVELLENMARRVTGSSHFEVPVHNALVQALSVIYARLGLAATRKALRRAAQIGAGRSTDITAAAKRALGMVGMPADLDEAKSDADSYLAMMKRLGRQDELLRIFRDTTFWGTNSAEPVRQAALKLAGETETGDDSLNRLKNLMRVTTSYTRTGFEISYAWAAIVAREGRTRGLGGAIKRYFDERGLSDSTKGSSWTVLLAYMEAARLAGGVDVLGPLEELMQHSPGDITPVHEQPYFSSPDAWARALMRSGKFEEYSRSQGLNADGSPKPSKLQEMLTNRTRPMLVAAALRAIAYARDPSMIRRALSAPEAPKGDLPDIHPGPAPAPVPFNRGPSNPRFRDDWPPHGDGYMW